MSGQDAAQGRPSGSLRALRVAAPLGALAMFVTIVTALGTGESLGEQGAAIGALVWGRVTLVDLGLALTSGWLWVAWRGRRIVPALVWLGVIAVTGAGGLLLYVTMAAWRAKDLHDVLMGDRSR